MKILNAALLVVELLICLTLLLGLKISFGLGGMDTLIIYLFYLVVSVHFIWTIKSKVIRLPVFIFLLFTISILLKASFLRGSEFPWDGDFIVNHGRLKPNLDSQITYSIVTTTSGRDSVFNVTLTDPKEKYLTTLWVSDPECTGCNDCMIDSGKLIIPDTLKKFVNDPISNDIILLNGKSPYQIEGEAYARYQIKGQVIGIKDGRVVFYVSKWKRR